MADDKELTVLVCSANIGNAEPTAASFAEWVPYDGEVAGSLSDTAYPVKAPGAGEVVEYLLSEKNYRKKKQFDFIVLGMQEAAFVDKSHKQQQQTTVPSTDAGDGDDKNVKSSGTGSTMMFDPNNVLDGVTDGVANGVGTIEREVKKNKLFRKVVKANLAVRGVTTQQAYTAGTLKKSKNGDGKLRENNAVRYGAYDTRKFVELIDRQCPSYAMVTAVLRGEMRLIVLALKDVAEEVDDVYIAGENTGIGSVLANKGGIIITCDLRGTRLSFMTAHLEAHEGATHYANRNKNIFEIFEGAKTDRNYPLHDATIVSHHMFVCGDLNYRINFSSDDPDTNTPGRKKGKKKGVIGRSMKNAMKAISDSERSEKEEVPLEAPPSPGTPAAESSERRESTNGANGSHFATAKALVEAEDWKTLNHGDELAMALKKKDCLVGFNTLPCNWPPTFKVAREEGYQYNEKRTPSYTDRILWKSADGMADNVVPFLYEPCPGFITSDHKPIRGGYIVKMNQVPSSKPSGRMPKAPQVKSDRHINLLITDLKCTNLPIMDVGLGLSDPYILFVSNPKPLLWKNAWPSTKVIKRELNPVWQEDMHLTLDIDGCINSGTNILFDGSMLYMTVIDEDISSGDDVIGTVALSLKELCSELSMDVNASLTKRSSSGEEEQDMQETQISRPILRNCQEYGMLECTVTSAFCNKKETKKFLNLATKKVRSKTRKNVVAAKWSALWKEITT